MVRNKPTPFIRLQSFFFMLILGVTSCIKAPMLNKSITTTISPPVDPGTVVLSPPDVPFEEISMQAGYGVRGSWFELYFTNPSPDVNTGGPEDFLVLAIEQARHSVDVAAYSMNLWDMRDALINAFHRGVTVRIVMESDNKSEEVPQELSDAGIPIVGDRREGLMHNKFVIIDRSEVWTGSMNFTISGSYRDNNNLVRIRAVKVADDYEKEFNEMFVDDKFGPDTVAETPNRRVMIDYTPVEIYFSPDDGVAGRILELLNLAHESIYFMAFSFTSDDLAKAIIDRQIAGVEIGGIMDGDQLKMNIGNEYENFRKNYLDVLLDANPGLMHHKVIIIDKRIVITGSYNFTASAEAKNDENIIIIFDSDIAAQYLSEYQRVYTQVQQ
jgi:phosphatidylserine/phosphatidylglycerophosphate/cardiolipin synthase-like enzyme